MQNAAFDVIGVFGFGKDFKATMDLHGEGAQACKCLAKGGISALNVHSLKAIHGFAKTLRTACI